MIVFILSVWTGSENVAIFLLFQKKTHLKMHLYNQTLAQALNDFPKNVLSRKGIGKLIEVMAALNDNYRSWFRLFGQSVFRQTQYFKSK